MHRMKTITLACVGTLALSLTTTANTRTQSNAVATSGSMAGSAGTLTAARLAGQNITVQGVAITGTTQTATFSCAITFFGAGTYQWNWTCSGGTITITNSDGSVAMRGKFTNAIMTLTGAGGGRGGHVSYTYKFSGTFTGSLTQNQKTQLISGPISTLARTTRGSGAPGNVVSFSLNW